MDPLKIHFLDIGYGDAIVIQLPEGGTILVDGGKPEDGPLILNKLQQLGVKQLTALIITHFHKDHAGGLLPIFDAFLNPMTKPDQGEIPIWIPLFPEEVTSEVKPVVQALQKQCCRIVKRGTFLPISSSVKIEVLHPTKKQIGNKNDDSLAIKIIHGKTTLLLAADIGLAAQRELLTACGNRLHADLIKIPHHANEIDIDFLNAVAPSISILTIGPNPYNAPNAEVVACYQEKGQLFRTDKHGTISVTSDEDDLQILCEQH
ncbi:MAG: ComEC/Rec2 family competence protein [Nitrospiria bacterium]